MIDFEGFKDWLSRTLGVSHDALHVHVGLLIFFVCLLVFRWPVRSWKPALVVFGIAFVGEVWDVLVLSVAGFDADLGDSLKDLLDTSLWPVLIVLIARRTTIFGPRSGNGEGGG